MQHIHAAAAALALVFAASSMGAQEARIQPAPVEVNRHPAISTLNGFVENRGQWSDEVRFLARQNGIEAVLLDDRLVLHPMPRRTERRLSEELGFELEPPFERPAEPEPVPGPPLTLRFPEAPSLAGEGVLPTAHHFLLGTGSTRNVPGFERVVYRDVVDGIDVVVRTGGGSYAYDLHVEPGADLGALTLEIEGASAAELLSDTVLALETSAGRVEMRIGESWEVDPATSERLPVTSRFQLAESDDGRLHLGFEAPGRDSSRAFVLDPSLVYATYVGGTGQDAFRDMDVAADGSVYIVADTGTAPTTPGAFQTVQVGGLDAWAGKLSPDGSTLEWGTYFGGSASDAIASIAVDEDGTAVLYGTTWSPDFPISPGSLDTVNENAPSKSDLFISRLLPDGSDFVWSTFYGGPDHEADGTLALFPNGDVLIFGQPAIATPPATPGAIDTDFVVGDRLLARITADGTQLVFQTYFLAGVNDIAFDGDSNIYLTGSASSQFTHTTPGAYKEVMGPGAVGGDAQISKLNPLGTQVIWSTFLGGDLNTDFPLAIALDAAGAVYVAGWTTASDFPITTGSPGGNFHSGFVTKLLPGGSDLVWSRSLSSCCGMSTFLYGLVVDPAGSASVAGNSNSSGFPTTTDAPQPAYIGTGNKSDAHLTKIDPFGESLVYSTYFGGGGSDTRPQIGLDAKHDLHMVMESGSDSIPTTRGVYGPDYAGGEDLVAASFSMPVAPWRVLGEGLMGNADTPNLSGAGDLTPGSTTRFSVRGGAPFAPALLSVGFSSHLLSQTGGMALAPTGLSVSTATNAQGALDLSFSWPSLPPGLRLTSQVWIEDSAALGGWSTTNKLRLISQ